MDTLSIAEVFMQRFLQHVLLKGFVKVRYYGLLAPGNRKRLAQPNICSARQLRHAERSRRQTRKAWRTSRPLYLLYLWATDDRGSAHSATSVLSSVG